MNKKIAVLPGDGIGPEVIEQALKVLDAIAERYGHYFEYCHGDVGHAAIEKTGDPLPPSTLHTCMNSDAILFGAIGHPKYNQEPEPAVRPEHGLLRLRKSLGLYANIRPVIAFPKLHNLSPLKPEKVKGVDLVIFRELTGGIYFGESHRDATSAYDTMAYEDYEIERIAKLAFESAMKRRKVVTVVDKANVLQSSKLWRRVVRKVAKDFPEVELDFMFVDNAAMQMIQDPRHFDVILTSNLFGDIISDEASVLTGSMGLLPSASKGVETSLFEPIHGSYPQAAGEDIANPIATILSASLMLEDFGLIEEAKVVLATVRHLLEKGIGTKELNIDNKFTCSQIGDMVAYLIAEKESINITDFKLKEKNSTII